jgi:pyruvate/2-oxoglutarate dehydrogenase complex dihydrolipoamide acyltransferase (E2) component
MGLLDKAGEMQGGAGAAKKPAKKAKAAPKSRAKAAPAKAKPAKAKVKKPKSAIDRSLPDEFVLASKGNRVAAASINFVWNWGAVVAGVALNIIANAQITMILIVGGIMAAANIIVIPTNGVGISDNSPPEPSIFVSLERSPYSSMGFFPIPIRYSSWSVYSWG